MDLLLNCESISTNFPLSIGLALLVVNGCGVLVRFARANLHLIYCSICTARYISSCIPLYIGFFHLSCYAYLQVIYELSH